MLSLDDNKRQGFDGGYRIKYDVSIPLKKLEFLTQPNEVIWNELWGELFHQRLIQQEFPHLQKRYWGDTFGQPFTTRA